MKTADPELMRSIAITWSTSRALLSDISRGGPAGGAHETIPGRPRCSGPSFLAVVNDGIFRIDHTVPRALRSLNSAQPAANIEIQGNTADQHQR